MFHNLNRLGIVKTPLARLRASKQNSFCLATFRAILIEPLTSALNSIPLTERYNPRFTRLPDAFHFSGFSPYTGISSLSKLEAAEV